MDIQDELEYLCPLPMKMGEKVIYCLNVAQVLTFLHRSKAQAGVAEFFIEHYGVMNKDLVDLYYASTNLLTLPEDQEKLFKQKEDNKTNFGVAPKETAGLFIMPSLLAVAKIAKLSLKEVLAMPITHYNLCLVQIRDNYEAEKKTYEKSQKGKK